MKTAKTIFLSAAIVMFCFPVIAQDNDYSLKQKYSITTPANVNITTNISNIEVLPHDQNFIEVYYTIKKKNEVLELDRERMEDIYGLKVEAEDNKFDLTLEAEEKGNLFQTLTNRAENSIRIFAPNKSTLTVNSSKGDISLRGFTGDPSSKSTEGNVKIANITGHPEVTSSKGNVQVSNIEGSTTVNSGDGNMNVFNIRGGVNGKSEDGNIQLRDIGGKTQITSLDGNLDLSNIKGDINGNTNDGNINLQNVRGAIKVESNDGNISFEGLVGSLDANSADGNIKGSITRLEDQLTLMAGDGNIQLTMPSNTKMDLKVEGDEIDSNFKNFNGNVDEKLVEGKMNGGGIPADITARNGKVSIEFE